MKTFFLLAVFLLLPFSASATTPTISNATGTLATGQTLTITGTNMAQEVKTNWDSFFTTNPNASGFEGASQSADGYSPPNSQFQYQNYDTTVKLMDKQSYHVYGNETGFGTNLYGGYLYFVATRGAVATYARFYTRFNSQYNNWPTTHTKMFYPMNSGEFEFMGGNNPLPTMMNLEYSEGSGNADHYATIPSGMVQNNRWYCVEYRYGGADHAVQAWIDGQLIYNATNNVTTGDPYVELGIINYADVGAPFYLDEWFDDLALSSTRIFPAATIEISGDGGTTWKWQPPTNLSETLIVVSEELPTLTVANYKLRVTNNQQQVSSTYTLGSADTTPPSAPSGLSVS